MIYSILGILLVIADQVAKFWAKSALAQGDTVAFIPHVLDFVYVENRGAAFGILQDTRWLLIGMTVAVLAALLFYMIKTKRRHPVFLLSVSLIFAGGIGNLIDRVFFGYVTDFIHLLFMEFPCFNIADICVSVGGVLLVVYLLFIDEKLHKAKQGDTNV